MLGVEHAGSLRGEAEEVGVEFLDAGQQGRPSDVGAVGQRLLPHSGVDQVVLGQVDDGLHPVAQVAPELRQRRSAGKPAGHADDSDRVGRRRG